MARRIDMSQYASFGVGDVVRAFHPGTLGVVKTGRVVKIGHKYVHVDFGELGGGTWRVLHAHVIGVE